MAATISFGADYAIPAAPHVGRTVSSILNDGSVRTTLGFDDNVQGYVRGQAVDGNYVLAEGDSLSIQSRAAQKAGK